MVKKTFILLALVFLNSFVLLAQNQNHVRAKSVPVSVQSIVAIEDSTRSLNFHLLGRVNRSCLSYSGFRVRIIKEGAIYGIQAMASKDSNRKCEPGDFVIPVSVPFPLLARHEYTFHFWQSDSTTVDTTVFLR